jgi:hypothetical protein
MLIPAAEEAFQLSRQKKLITEKVSSRKYTTWIPEIKIR